MTIDVKLALTFSIQIILTPGLCLAIGATVDSPRLHKGPTLKTELESRAINFFIDNAHPQTGLVRDSAEDFTATPANNRMASIASTGFGLAVIANASTRGLITHAYALNFTRKTLKFVRQHVPSHDGWFLHFVDWETGERFGNSEYSTIDTAIFVAGALYAKQVLNDPEISSLADSLYAQLDFQSMLTDGNAKPDKKTLSMGYLQELGYTPSQWSMPAEQMLLLLLGLGHPTHPLPPSTWLAWSRESTTLSDGEKLIGYDMPLFVHQYSQLFVDLRNFHDLYANYFNNASLATKENREVCLGDSHFQTFREGFWGLSAGESPNGYSAFSPTSHSSTVCLGCRIGSAMYDLDGTLTDARQWLKSRYAKNIWGKYGFVDSIDLDQNWFASNVLGITVGPIYLSLVNTDENTSIWRNFNLLPEIRRALDIASKVRPPDDRRSPGVKLSSLQTAHP